MADGSWKNMEDLYIGDQVMGIDIPTVPYEDSMGFDYIPTWTSTDVSGTIKSVATVINVDNRSFDSYYLINNQVKVTYEHNVLVQQDGIWKFIMVEDINVGDNIMNENLEIVPVLSKELINETVNTTSINIDDIDVYTVRGMVAHNITSKAGAN